MGSRKPPSAATATASITWGATCSGVTKLMLWQPRSWRSSISRARSPAVHTVPARTWEMSQFLAKNAAEVAEGEEDGPGPAPAAQAVLLSEMRKGARHDRVAAGVA